MERPNNQGLRILCISASNNHRSGIQETYSYQICKTALDEVKKHVSGVEGEITGLPLTVSKTILRRPRFAKCYSAFVSPASVSPAAAAGSTIRSEFLTTSYSSSQAYTCS